MLDGQTLKFLTVHSILHIYIDRWNAIDISVIRRKFAISSRVGLSSVILQTSLFYRHSLDLIHRGSQFTGNPLSTDVRQIFRCTEFFFTPLQSGHLLNHSRQTTAKQTYMLPRKKNWKGKTSMRKLEDKQIHQTGRQ